MNSMNPIFYFIAFFIFLLCQYCMLMVSVFVANLSHATGHYYWSLVFVIFILLNKLCFSHYNFELNDDEDYEWLGDENN